jgi:hypothetical protein
MTITASIKDVNGVGHVFVADADEGDGLSIELINGKWEYDPEIEYDPMLFDEGEDDIFGCQYCDVIWMSYAPKYVADYDEYQQPEYGSTPVYK